MKSEKIAQFVAKLLRDTQEKKLKWIPLEPAAARKSFTCEISNRILLLTHDKNRFEEPLTLRIYNSLEEPVAYVFVDVPGLDDLYETATYTAAGIDDFIDEVLKSDV